MDDKVQMRIDRDDEVGSSSDSENETKKEDLIKEGTNSISIKLDVQDAWKAEIVYNALVVDKEPKRSRSHRELSVDGNYIIANFKSDDPKSLMKSANNFFEMCQLSRNCIEIVGNYKFKPLIAEEETKKSNRRKNKMK